MTTLRKKKEFKKSLKKQNNKTSKNKLRKPSKKKISKKKKLVAGSKLGGTNDADRVVLQRVISGTRDSNDIYKVLLTIGRKFVNEYNLHYDPKIELRHRGTRISPKDGSVYLTIQFASPVNGQKLEIFHLSDHPGISTSLCGAIHIKQIHRFDRVPLNQIRCFKIGPHTTEPKLSLFTFNSVEDNDFQTLKNFIENISQNDIIELGLYPRFTEQQLNDLGSPFGKGEVNAPDSLKTKPPKTPERIRQHQLNGTELFP